MIHFTYQLPSGEYQTLATVDTVDEALYICNGYQNIKLFIGIEGIPALLKGIREYNNLTLDQLAEKIQGYSKQTLSAIENGRRDIGFKVLQNFGKAFNIEFGISATIK